jgi:hypothetical protein
MTAAGQRRQIVTKRKNRILEGARQALAIAKGDLDASAYAIHVPDAIDVRRCAAG